MEVVSKRKEYIGGSIENILEVYSTGTELMKYIEGSSAKAEWRECMLAVVVLKLNRVNGGNILEVVVIKVNGGNMLKLVVITVNGGNILEVEVITVNEGNILEVAVIKLKKGKILEEVVLELNGVEMLIGGSINLSE